MLKPAPENAVYKCTRCNHVVHVKKGQWLPPACTRCGGALEKHEGPEPPPQDPAC